MRPRVGEAERFLMRLGCSLAIKSGVRARFVRSKKPETPNSPSGASREG